MLKKLLTAVFVMLAFPVASAFAQTGTITGTITDTTSGTTLPGVNVRLTGTDFGTATDAQGEFEIAGVPTGDYTLVASFVGYEQKTMSINVDEGVNEVRIRMVPSVMELQDVVVTALGVEREEASLGYSVQNVEGEELAEVPETNFISGLQGKVAGANFNVSNTLGGSTRIVLRGANSVLGDNEPLIVVDGVPINNANYTDDLQAGGAGGYDYGNAASIINPSDVQSVSVLKGPAASALYGSRGANGVIQITTKSGEGAEGVGVTINTSLMASSIYGLPNYQNEFGGGYFHPFQTLDGDFIQDSPEDDFVVSYSQDESWGPRLDGRMVRQWYSWDEVNGLLGESTPWVAHPGNIENYFSTGLSSNSTVAFSQGGENFNYRASLSNVIQTGTMPNSRLGRQSVGFNGSVDLTENFDVQVVGNYYDTDAKGREGTGYANFNPFLQFNTFGQRQVDLGEGSYMADIFRPNGDQRGWNWAGVSGAQQGIFQYTDNPYFIREESFQTDDTERIFGKTRLTYDFTDRLTLSAEAGTDHYTERRQQRTDAQSIGLGDYTEQIFEVQETQVQSRLTWDGQLSEDFSLRTFGATSFRYETLSENLGSTVGGLIAEEVFTVENSVSRPSVTDYFREQGVYSLYGQASFGWRDLLFLDVTARNDWSSTLPAENNSYFYPSVAGSFVFSRLPALSDSEVLSFGKLRLSYARVGNDTGPYQLLRTFPVGTPFGSRPVQQLSRELPNNELLPEITSGPEIGVQLDFFNNRLGLDATYYYESTRNQILPVDVSFATGYNTVVLNAGEITNQGAELALTSTPVLTDDFQWNVDANWAKNVSEVVELAEGLQTKTISFSSAGFGPDIQARVGERYGQLYGTSFVRDANGNVVLTAAGTPAIGPTKSLGSYQPDWTGDLSTTLSYKGLSASVSFTGQMGGKIYSLSNAFGLYSGLLQETVDDNVRALGVNPGGVTIDQEYNFNPDDDIPHPSELEGEEFEGRLPATAYFHGSFFAVNEAAVYDASYIQLREARLAYTFPLEWFGNWPIRNLTVSAIGQNLGLLYKEAPNINPASAISAGNAQGFESGQIPPKRQYGLSLRLEL